MKWQQRQFNTALGGSMPPFVLVYGEDGGKAKDLARKAALSVTDNLDDVFAVDRLRAEDILEEPSRIADSASTISMGVDTRLVYIEGVSNALPAAQLTKIAGAVEMALERLNSGSIIVMAAAGIDNKHAIVKHVEKHAEAAALRCYVSSARDLTTEINQYFASLGKRVEPAAMAFLQENLGNDGAITQRELEVLSLYVGENPSVTLEDCMETVSSAPSLNVFKLCDALGNRDRAKVDVYIRLLQEEGQDATMISAAVLRHLRRIMQVQQMMASGMRSDAAMKSLKPPVFYGQAEFEAQVRKYPASRLQTLAEKFYEITMESRAGTLPPDLVLNRALLSLSF